MVATDDGSDDSIKFGYFGRIERTQAIVFSGDETADVGIDLATAVVEEIGSGVRSRFTGTIESVRREVK